MNGSIVNALICIVAGGLTALVVTFGIALKLHLEEASFVANIANKIARQASPIRAKSTLIRKTRALPQPAKCS